VLNGHAAVDESPITGESLPVEKFAGSTVFAGSISRSGTIWLRADRIAGETTLARIVRRVEEAQEEKAAIERFIDHFARWYTPAAGVLAILVLLFTHRIESALTLLVIASPGALVISTPAYGGNRARGATRHIDKGGRPPQEDRRSFRSGFRQNRDPSPRAGPA
jgi:Zn2+/Cd2+-exporting ATPase